MNIEQIKQLADKYEVPVEQMMIAISTFEKCQAYVLDGLNDYTLEWVLEDVFVE